MTVASIVDGKKAVIFDLFHTLTSVEASSSQGLPSTSELLGVDVVAWNRLAELCQQYLVKGRSILVEGRLQYDEWKTKEGEARNKLRVRADIIRFLGSPQGAREPAAGTPGGRTPPAASAAASTETPPTAVEEVPQEPAGDADDLPF